MGDDEYHPISKKGSNLTIAGGIGYTVVDSLDTMLMMGLHDEYSRARDWVDKKLDFNRDANFNTFEVSFIPSSFITELMTISDDYSCSWRIAISLSHYK